MTELIIQSGEDEIVMSSLDFADLTERQHGSILSQIDNLEKDLLEMGEIDKNSGFLSYYKDVKGRRQRFFNLTKKYCELLAMGMDRKIQIKVYNRMKELENALSNKNTALPENFSEALRLLADSNDEKVRLEEKNIVLIETNEGHIKMDKKQYGSIGGNVKRKNKYKQQRDELKIQLDESDEYHTVRKLEKQNKCKYNWRLLKSISDDMGYKTKKIPDPLYGEVNVYNKNVWIKAYNIKFD